MSGNQPATAPQAHFIDDRFAKRIVDAIVEEYFGQDIDAHLDEMVGAKIEARLRKLELIDVKGIAARTTWHADKVRRLLTLHKIKSINTGERGRVYRVTTIEKWLESLES